MDFPKLRPIHAVPIQHSGQTLVCLQDPQNIAEKNLFLSPPLYFIVTLFDGQHSVLDIQAAYMRRFGDFLFTDKIEEIISQLEENLFLEGERFERALREKDEAFRRAPVREAAFAGKSYEEDPERLRAQLENYFLGPEGPGALGERKGRQGLKGVIAPHIDFQRGGFCYAHAYQEIWEKNACDCFVIFGTAHTPLEHPFCLTRKDFKTPLGSLNVDGEFVDALQSRCPDCLFEGEGVHRSEHSIEFQCLFLRYLFPDPAPLAIVPILSGSLHEAMGRGVSPMDFRPVRNFLEALKETVFSLGREVCFIASADLSHMGPQFGDPGGMGPHDLRTLEEADVEMLRFAERMDGEGFFSSVAKDMDRRRICGLPAIYALLNVLDAQEGRLLKYGQAFTPETRSVVSFASMAFY